ncbi:hypothetical protein SE88_00625 [Helicobacter pylori]|uniref:DUF874 family protein n=2 Tax=Helicobacter pylori TaxID=210 RepID=O24938_HELPY|nr:DUF874 family protein [Helicobacter pylori]AAD07190.1 predicted coding region HP0119 [Helicobacter pylori 26695]AFV41339.1 hypothetical protein C694_00590 [Helicobacter pylori 26695]AFV42932.1 hypothetical protein C695_00585 [Helicobacter pylori Rif1]AFV44527.1 hypothetical protein C730_00585 [Helicobacter pylori Rif2]AJF08433.1 hypothetical protein SE87_00625 [Helicobacter pylori 26695-1]
MPVIRVLVMLATMMMKLVKTAKEKKVFKNVGMSIMGIAFWEAIKDSIKKQIKKSNWICGNVKTADDYLKTHPNSWFNSAIGVTTITAMLMNVCFADDQSKKEVAETQKEAENARDRANKSGIELEQEQQKTEQEKQKTEQEKQKTEQEKQKTSNIETNNQIKVEQKQQKTEQEKQKTEQEKQKTEQEKQKTEQEKQKTSNIETNNQIKVEQKQQKTEQEKQKTEQEKQKTEQEKQKTEQEKQKTSNIETNNQIKVEQEQQKTEQEKQKTNNTQKDLVKYAEQNCQENHNQFFIKKLGIKGGIAIEVEAECKTPKPAKTNQTPIQPKHLPNSKQPHSQRGSKAQEFIAYLQKELEFLPYSQKAIAKQVNFYKPSSIAYLELDPRDFKVTEEWQKENLKIRSKAQAKMLEMRDLKPDPQAHLPTSQSLLFVQKIFADVNKEIEAVANTEKKAEKAGYGYSKRM